MIGALLLGTLVRSLALGYTTPDWEVFLGPWYDHMRVHGFAGLAVGFTNYTPFYTYLLGVASLFDGLASPVTLVKLISYPFEFGNAVVAACIVRLFDPTPRRAAIAFAALWLSPGVLHNGAFWAQCDSIWTFFVLLAVWAASLGRTRWAILAFAVAVSIKFQAMFVAPFVLGAALHHRRSILWFAVVPAVYLVLAAPALIAGRPLLEVATVYLDQANDYRTLWKGAANLYMFVPDTYLREGTSLGILAATLCGLWLAWAVARAKTLSREGVLIAAALSLALMPFLLPRMHERFFYGFDAVVIILACARPLFAPVAVVALVNSLNCYLPFDGRGEFGQSVAGLQSLVIIGWLVVKLRSSLAGLPLVSGDPARDTAAFLRPTAALWFAYIAYRAGTFVAFGPGTAALWPERPAEPTGLLLFLAALVGTVALLRRTMPLPSLRPSALEAGIS